MRRGAVLTVTVAGFVAAFAYGVSAVTPAVQQERPALQQQAAPAPQVAAAPADHRAVLQKYCFSCHSDRMKAGNLVLSTLDLERIGEHAEEWEKVIRKVSTGAMPPVGRPRPEKAVASALITHLENELDRAAMEHPNPGRPSLQRLNRSEYRNAVRDLLGVEIDAASMLPADVAGHGFDNNADALTLSSALMERYLGAAAKIGQMALARPRGLPTPETFFVPTDRDQSQRISDELPFGSRGGTAFRYYFPADGEYVFEIRPKESGAGGGFQGVTAEPHDIDVAINNVKVWGTVLGGPAFARRRGYDPNAVVINPADQRAEEDRNKKILDALTFRVPVKAGTQLVQVYFRSKTSAYLEDLFDRPLRRDPYRAGNGEPHVSSVTITGPQQGTFTVTETPSRRKIFTCAPTSRQSGDTAEAETCATRIISTLARRAYRRPVGADDLRVPMTAYREGAKKGGFEAGIEMGIRAILVSPNFLFRLEQEPAAVAANAPYKVSDIDLASRLSFFLWSSIPDDELLALAEKNQLRNQTVLARQVQRMLADEKSQALVDNFAGQWLHIRNVAVHQPSPELLFHFDDNLRRSFEQETKLFFESIVRENRSVLELLDADYTYLNERLARHYGINGVAGERFRRVSLPEESPRRGIMGKGSVLMSTSYPNRTSPVIRGKWILENIFGAPPPAPPPNVPDLKDERDPKKVLPMREQMAAHRANPACAGCHAQMDQLGFALENFDAIGEWRDIYPSGATVDASAELPDGTKFNGPTELRKVLLAHSDEFMTNVADKMLTYALGRGLEAHDGPAVRRIKRETEKGGYRFTALVQSIVTSMPFQMRAAQDHAN